MSNDKVTILTQKSVIVVAPNSALPGGGGVSDHGALTGLADDDHTQYALADGSRGPAHGQLTGLDADDHTQYALTDGSRGSFATVAQGALADSAVQPTIVDVKGDLVVATAADTLARLAVGADTLVLTADSAEATGLKWAAAGGGGGGDLVDDTTPQLGGNLDLNTFSIIGTGVSISPTVIQLASTGSYQFSSGAVGAASDVILARDDPNALAMRNGTAAQSFRLYNTDDGGTNYERLAVQWETNKAVISTQNAGTGTQRTLALRANGVEFAQGNGAGAPVIFKATASNTLSVLLSSVAYYRFFTSNSFELHPNIQLSWGSANAESSPDTGLKRVSAALVKVTNGSTGSGSLECANLASSGGTVNMTNLPTSDPTVAGQVWNNSGVLTVSAG